MGQGRRKRKLESPRTTINVFNFFLTVGVLIFAVKLADGSFVNHIDMISKNINFRLKNLFMSSSDVDYTEINKTASYYSTAKYNPKGMGGLFNLTNSFINWIVPKDFIPEGK